APLAPRGVPRRLARFLGLPENEVLEVLFLVLVVRDAVAAARLRQVDARELAVTRERGDPEVHGSLGLVRVLLLQELRRDLLHPGDVVGGAGIVIRALQAQPVDVAEEELR